VSVCRLSKFDNDRLLSFISCLQITHDAIYFTYKPSRASNVLGDIAGVHDPPDVEVFPVVGEDMEDGFEDGWEDEDSEDEDEDPVGMGAGADGQYLWRLSPLVTVLMWPVDPVHAILNNWFLPTPTNTVYSVGF
jgi:hypothetical protein